LVRAIAAYKIYPVSAGIIIGDFTSFTEPQRRFLTGGTLRRGKLVSSGCPNKPYFTSFQWCIRTLVKRAPVGGKAHFFFGLDRPFAKYATSLYRIIKEAPRPDGNRDRLGEIAFPLAKETPQLQAADLLTYLTYEHVTERLHANDWSVPPKSLLAQCLANGQMDEQAYFDRACLQSSLDKTYAVHGNWDRGNTPSNPQAFEREEEEDLP
jgi:hypothetical protein